MGPDFGTQIRTNSRTFETQIRTNSQTFVEQTSGLLKPKLEQSSGLFDPKLERGLTASSTVNSRSKTRVLKKFNKYPVVTPFEIKKLIHCKQKSPLLSEQD